MGAHIPVAPLGAAHRASAAGQLREALPVAAEAGDGAAVAPVVIALAVGGEVDVAALGLAGRDLVIADEPLPQILGRRVAAEDVAHDRLGAVAEVFEHAADVALVVE